jgi:predicted ATPase/signal transduction histidine kinase/ActR/RegA family two-component response regulator
MPSGYLHVERLGEGSGTTLYRAVRRSDGRAVLLEVLNDEQYDGPRAALLANQLELGQALKSELMLRPLGVSTFEGRRALELEDSAGTPLESLGGAALANKDFVDLAVRMTSAVADLHHHGIVHGALSRRYILVDAKTGTVKLFGWWHAQRVTLEGQVQRPVTLSEAALPYVSPEQTGRFNRRVDWRTDLYSLGVIFFELLCGRLPFDAKDASGWVHSHLARKPPVPSEIRASVLEVLSRIVLKLLEKAPHERYQSAAGLLRDLRQCQSALRATGTIPPFSLGRADVCVTFMLPQKLYGRDRERAMLLESFERAASGGPARLLLVSGAAGAGKSSLIGELQSPSAARGGRFIVGKFEQLKREVPYTGIVDALRQLVLDLLVEGAERIGEHRSRINGILGTRAALVYRLLPELGLLLGSQPPAFELPPAEVEKRLRRALRQLVGAFATHEQPLLVFLDDVQWIDRASIDLLAELVSETDLQHLLIVAAYRDTELGPLHPLRHAIDGLVAAGAAVDELQLQPLSVNDLAAVVTDLACVTSAEALPLARAIHDKTYGNPFFVVQLLSELHRRALIVPDLALGHWRWDLPAIVEAPCTENVTELLVARLRELPVETQETLGVAAHLGRSFPAATLALVVSHDPGSALKAAVDQGLLAPIDQGYQFPHDRLREAAYSIVPERERAATHLRIGRVLLAATPPERLDERSFELVSHFNLGAALLTAAERESVAELNLRAGQRAAWSAAHASALSYFAAGSALLAEDCWERRYELAFALGIRQVESQLSMGELAAVEERLDQLEISAQGMLDRSAVACARANLLLMRSEFTRSLEALLGFLAGIGIDWSLTTSDDSVRDEYQRLRDELGDREIESLLELQDADSTTQATMEVLFKVGELATASNDRLMRLVFCRMARLSLEHGLCDASALAFAHLGQMMGPYFGDYHSGFRFARLGLKLQEARQQSRFRQRVFVIAGAYVYPWTQPFAQGLELLRLGFAAAVEHGDPVFAWLATVTEASLRLFMGAPLAEVERLTVRAREIARKAKLGPFFADMVSIQTQLIRALRGMTSNFPCFDEADFNELEFEAHLTSDPNLAIPEGWYWIRKLRARYHGGDYGAAHTAAERAEALIWTTGFALERLDYFLYGALTSAAGIDAASPQERDRCRATLVEGARTLEARARDCSSNFGSCAALLAAELARVDGDERAAELYEQAIRSARDHELLPILALAYEAASAFYRARGFALIAETYLREARNAYRHWGAEGKVKQLEQRNASLASPRTTDGPLLDLGSEQLDLLAVVKASHVISSLTLGQQVLDTLLALVLEQGGARRALLVLTNGVDQDREPSVAAEASVDDASPLLQPAPRLPTSIIDYVRRTGSLVLLEDATADAGPFAQDPYLTRARPRSVLCLPVRRYGTLAGILYLDNDLAPGVFTPNRLLALELLATQAAVSLQNADLLARERAAREEAQRDRRRALLLGKVTALLSDSGERPTLTEALRSICAHGLADWAVLNLTQPGVTKCVAHAHRDPQKEPLLLEFAERHAAAFCATQLGTRTLSASAPFHQASLSDRQIRACCAGNEHTTLARKLGLRSLLALPLVARGAQLGTLFLVAARPHHFQPADIALSCELGGRVSMALESARLAELENLLRQAQKMEAIGRLAGGVAHDFNNVLSVILTCAQFARERLAPEDPACQELEEIAKAAERATGLTRQLLAFSRHRLDGSGVLDVNRVMSDLNYMLATLVGAHVRLVFEPAESLWKTRADQAQLEQLLMNLAANARDSMPRGGSLLMRTSNVELTRAYAREHVDVVPGQYVLLAVSDTGCGMEPEVQARIFEPFFTTKQPGEGTGIGLATVLGVVRQSGGHISVESELGRGTTFKIYLPRCTAAADELEASAVTTAASMHGSETVLLVEDDDRVRSAARKVLRREGYSVLEASSPGDALLICEQHAGPIHLLLSDIVMPLMRGPELAERIAAIRPGLRFLFMSGYTDMPFPRQTLGDYAVDLLQKPFTPETLGESVRNALNLRSRNGTHPPD